MFSFFKVFFLVIAAVIVAVFAANNNQSVEIDLYPLPLQYELSVFIIVFVCMFFGAILSGSLTSIRLLYWRRVGKNAQKHLKKLEDENKQLRKQLAGQKLHKYEA